MNKEEFIKAVKQLKVDLTEEKLEKLNKFYNLLIEWNKKINLTRIEKEDEVYLKHFYDSLTITKIINIENMYICDIGSGAGFPGIVLKIVFPKIKIDLVEATEKRCNFLKLVIEKLNLKDISVINERAEIYSKEVREKYDLVTSRAVAPLKHLLEYSIPLVKVNGYYVAMKGIVDKELDNIDNYYRKLNITLVKEIKFLLPQELSNRTLLLYKKNNITNLKYPRRYNEIKKKDI